MNELMQLDQLIQKFLSGQLSEKEQEMLFQWRDASPRNQQTFARLTDPEWLGKELQKMTAVQTEDAWQKLQTATKPPVIQLPKRRFSAWKVAAAVLLLCAGLATWQWLRPVPKSMLPQAERFKNDVAPGKEGAVLMLADGRKVLLDSIANGNLSIQSEANMDKQGGQLNYQAPQGKEVVYHTLSTPRSRKFRLVLSDGTVVLLNAASSIKFPTAFEGPAREVEVEGEVFFEVTKTGKPFMVNMKGMQVEVMGTRFNMNDHAGEGAIKTTLEEGSVKVTAAGVTNSVMLKPGEETAWKRSSNSLATGAAELEETLGWTNHLFVFNDTGIEQVMQQLERWYDIEVIYERKVTQHFSGFIPMDENISKVLELLELTKGVKFLVEGKKVTVLGN